MQVQQPVDGRAGHIPAGVLPVGLLDLRHRKHAAGFGALRERRQQPIQGLAERLKRAQSRTGHCVLIRATLGSTAAEIAQLLGWSVATVHVMHSRYAKEGEAIFDVRGRAGRHHEYLTTAQEQALLAPFGAMVSQTSGHGDTRLPHERSRRFFGKASMGEEMGYNFIADGRDEVLTATRETLRYGATQIKAHAGGGAATAYDPLDVSQYTLDELKAAVEAADDWNTYVTVHAYNVHSVRRAVEAGVKCIEHGQLLDEATIKLLADKGVFLSLQALDPAPSWQPANIREKKDEVIRSTDAAFRWAKQHKVKLL